MDKINKQASLYEVDIDLLISKVEAAPNDEQFKSPQDIIDYAQAMVNKFEIFFRDKRGAKTKQTVSNQKIRTLFIVMEGKWRELGGTGIFPKPDEPGSWGL